MNKWQCLLTEILEMCRDLASWLNNPPGLVYSIAALVVCYHSQECANICGE